MIKVGIKKLPERRQAELRRQVNDWISHEGGFPIAGKFLIIWLVIKHADIIVPHWELLLVLLGYLIMPKVIEKIALGRYSSPAANGEKK